jgi:hypothetical protein
MSALNQHLNQRKEAQTMSGEHVQLIIGRAVMEPAYRALLFSDPGAALAGYQLTHEERMALAGLVPERFDALASELEARLSRTTDLYDWHKIIIE